MDGFTSCKLQLTTRNSRNKSHIQRLTTRNSQVILRKALPKPFYINKLPINRKAAVVLFVPTFKIILKAIETISKPIKVKPKFVQKLYNRSSGVEYGFLKIPFGQKGRQELQVNFERSKISELIPKRQNLSK